MPYAFCQVCGQQFQYFAGPEPKCCLRLDCIEEAIRRGWYKDFKRKHAAPQGAGPYQLPKMR